MREILRAVVVLIAIPGIPLACIFLYFFIKTFFETPAPII
jgi:hypothetical protein